MFRHKAMRFQPILYGTCERKKIRTIGKVLSGVFGRPKGEGLTEENEAGLTAEYAEGRMI
jgi:hypothetical protein